MPKDWFAAFASDVAPKSRATGATRATSTLDGQTSVGSEPSAAFAGGGNAEATRATPQGHTRPVALVARAGNVEATARAMPGMAEMRRSGSAVAPVARVAHDIEHQPLNELEGADWREMYEERAAVRQYCGGYHRDIAEWLAWGEVIERWCELHPMSQQPGICAGCSELLGGVALDLCDGARVHWERRREFACLIAYGAERKRRAVEALAALGLQPPMGWGT
jgi:hypothetical protein